MVTTSWIFSHATEADNLVVEGTLANATKKSICCLNLQIILNIQLNIKVASKQCSVLCWELEKKINLSNFVSSYSNSCYFIQCCILPSFTHAKGGRVTTCTQGTAFPPHYYSHESNKQHKQTEDLSCTFGSPSSCLERATFVSSGRAHSRRSKLRATLINQKEEFPLRWSFWRLPICNDQEISHRVQTQVPKITDLNLSSRLWEAMQWSHSQGTQVLEIQQLVISPHVVFHCFFKLHKK